MGLFSQPQDVTSVNCAAHFANLSRRRGILHPNRVLNQLDRVGRMAHYIGFAKALQFGLILECEACVHWDGNKIDVQERVKTVHPDLLERFKLVLQTARAPPLRTYLNTRDNAFCHVAGQMASHVVGIGFSPPALVRGQTLLPLHANQLDWAAKSPNATAQQPWTWPAFDGCFWRGGNTGWHMLQAAFNYNRTTCLPTETDRQCVVKHHAPKARLLCPKRNCPPTRADRRIFERSQCILALDGNTYAAIFSRTLLAGRLAVRVGGWDATLQQRLSSFEWFEPLLVAGKHYVSTSIDGLGATIATITARPDGWRRRIARNGQEAIQALLTERSVLCYARLALDAAAVRSPASAQMPCPGVVGSRTYCRKGAPC